jgi:hypothetical protein
MASLSLSISKKAVAVGKTRLWLLASFDKD